MNKPTALPLRGTNLFIVLASLLMAGCAERAADTGPVPSAPSIQPDESDPAAPPSITMTPPGKLYSLTARSLGYQLDLVDVRVVGTEVWTLAELHYPTGMVGMALEELELRAALPSETTGIRHFIIGAPHGIFEPPDGLFWLNTMDELPPAWNEGRSLPQP